MGSKRCKCVRFLKRPSSDIAKGHMKVAQGDSMWHPGMMPVGSRLIAGAELLSFSFIPLLWIFVLELLSLRYAMVLFAQFYLLRPWIDSGVSVVLFKYMTSFVGMTQEWICLFFCILLFICLHRKKNWAQIYHAMSYCGCVGKK